MQPRRKKYLFELERVAVVLNLESVNATSNTQMEDTQLYCKCQQPYDPDRLEQKHYMCNDKGITAYPY